MPGDIGHRANQVQWLASFIPHHRAPGGNHRIIPVGPAKTIFFRPALPFPCRHLLYGREYPLTILRMDTVSPPSEIDVLVANGITEEMVDVLIKPERIGC